MAEALAAFTEFADFLPDPLLLVSTKGKVRAANKEATNSLLEAHGRIRGEPLIAFFEGPAANIEAYLRMCSRSTRPIPHVLKLRPTASSPDGADLHCYGWAIRGRDDKRFILLRLSPKQPAVSRFLSLNSRIEQLTREISLRLRAEQSAHEQRELLQVTLASIGDAVITGDISGNVTFMNPVAEAHTGWTAQEALGKSLDEVFVIRNEITRQPVESPAHEVLQTGNIVGLANHTVLIRKDGVELPIDDSGAPIRDSAGQLIGVVLVFHEIGERRKLERELRRQADALRQADKRKDEFLAMLAHELRNPLAPLYNCVQLLRARTAAPVDIDALADMMERQTGQLRRLVDDLLDISRITRGLINLEKRPTALTEIIEHAVETVEPLIQERKHTLEVHLPVEPVVVNADMTRLSQVLCNLLTNAAKFMDPRGTIVITAAAEDDIAVIRVRDHGIGLTEDLLPYVFDLFSQGDRKPGREHGGLGIGLTLVKALVEMHGGEVNAFSAGAGEGSEFVVKLPVAAASASVQEKKHTLLVRKAHRRILIVDDNVDAAQSLAMLLTASGCEVHSVHDGRAAINAVQSAVPDIVLLDIGLPGTDGFEVARRLRRIPGLPALRIIAVTGYGSELDRERAKEAGFDHHLVKPVDLEELFKLLG